MKPIVYEIERNLRSKFVIIMIIAIVGLTSLLAYDTGINYHRPSFNTSNIAVGYYLSGNNLTMVSYPYNQYGNSLKDAKVSFDYNGTNYVASFDSRGFANSTFPIDFEGEFIQVNVTYSQSLLGVQSSSTSVYSISMNARYSGFSMGGMVLNRSNSSSLGLILMYVGPNGSVSPDSNLYMENSSPNSGIAPIGNYSYEYNVTGISIDKIYPSVNASQRNDTFAIWIKSSSGKLLPINNIAINEGLVIGKFSTYTPMNEGKLQSIFYSGTSSILGLFIPILAIFLAYLTYGKDRTSGVLESVLKRPVTRGGLITTRFVSNSLSIALAVALSIGFTDLILWHYLTEFFTATFVAQMIWTYVIEGVAFMALVYLVSHVVRSQGALLGVSIALFIVIDLFWGVFPLLISAIEGLASNSNAYVNLALAFDFASPAGYASLVEMFITNQFSGGLGSYSFTPSAFGINAYSIFITGILWIGVPFGLAYFLAKKRD